MIRVRELYSDIERTKDLGERAKLFFELCKLLLVKDPQKAVDAANELLRIGKKIEDRESIGKAFIILGRVKYKELKLEEAEADYRAAIEMLNHLHHDPTLRRAEMALGMVFWARSEYNTALDIYNSILTAIEHEESDAFRILYADLLTNMGNVYERMGKYDTTVKYYNRALDMIDTTTDREEGVYIRSNLAIIKGTMGLYSEAVEELLVCLEEFKKQGNKRDMSIVRINLATAYCEMKLYAESLTEYQKSVKLLKELDDERSLVSVYSGLSDVYLELQGYNDALKYANRCVQLAREIGYPTGLFDGLMSLSKAQLGLGEKTKAQQAFDEACEIADEKGLSFALDGHQDLAKALAEAS